jgi:outer membrane protein, heavy metal efflux system
MRNNLYPIAESMAPYNKMKCTMKHSFIVAAIAIMFSGALSAQVVLTEQDAIKAAISTHPSLKAAADNIEQRRQLEKTSFSLQGPNIYTQSPTGQFYTIGINQNIDFPTVYIKQKKVFQAETHLAENQLQLTEQQLAWNVRNAYFNAKYQTTKSTYLFTQDSLLFTLQKAAEKQFQAGEIDQIEKSFVDLQYGEVHINLLSAQSEAFTALQSLEMMCGISGAVVLPPYSEEELNEMINGVVSVESGSAQLLVAKSEVELANEMIKLEKNKALPGFQVGYLNQASRATPTALRFQAGIIIPLWWWQQRGRINAAKANAEKAAHDEQSIHLSYQSELNAAQQRLLAAGQHLSYYLQTGLPAAREIEDASLRYFKGGERSYSAHIRTLNDAMQVKFSFVEAALAYTEALAQLKFINGSK